MDKNQMKQMEHKSKIAERRMARWAAFNQANGTDMERLRALVHGTIYLDSPAR